MTVKLYTARAAEAYLITPLDELTIIYHRASGMTHIVGDPVPQIVSALHAEPLALEGILAALQREHDLVIDERAVTTLQARIDELLISGLIAQL
jgi:PqqD family protein of HPr-rel-A system